MTSRERNMPTYRRIKRERCLHDGMPISLRTEEYGRDKTDQYDHTITAESSKISKMLNDDEACMHAFSPLREPWKRSGNVLVRRLITSHSILTLPVPHLIGLQLAAL